MPAPGVLDNPIEVRQDNREQVKRVLLVALAVNISMTLLKLLLGLMSGSLAVLADAMHSATDGFSSLLGLVTNGLSDPEPDRDHPYGHHKYEAVGALAIAAFILFTAFEILQAALAGAGLCVLPAFIGQALRGEDLTVFGDGSQTRSFCYVTDQVEGIFRLLHSDYEQPVNIGNPDEITIKDFAEEIIKLTGTNQKVVYHPLPINDPLQRQPDTTKAKELLGWEAKVKRDEGMKLTYAYFKSLSLDELLKEEHKDFKGYIH